MKADEPAFPVTGWTALVSVEHQAMFLKLPFLSHPLQRPSEADPGRTYILTKSQLENLEQQIQKALRQLETPASPNKTGSRH